MKEYRMVFALTVCSCLLAIGVQTGRTAATLSLFNMRVGMTKSQAHDAHPQLTVYPSDPEGTDERHELGGILFKIKVKFDEDSLQEVCATFWESGFSSVVETLNEKYGQGKSTNSVLQNRMGAQFNQVKVIWVSQESALMATRYSGGSLETSEVCLTSNQLLESFGEGAKRAKDELKKGL